MRSNRRRFVAGAIVLAVLGAIAAIAVGTAVASVAPVVVGGRYPQDPAISGGDVVWADSAASGRGNDVYIYEYAKRAARPLVTGDSDQTDPDISGNVVAWVDYRAGNADVYALDLTTGVQTPVATANGDQVKPVVSNSWIAWEDISDLGGRSVYARNLATGESVGVDTKASNPRMAGSLIVYEKTSARGDADIRVYDVTTHVWSTVAAGVGSEMLPDTDGRYVTWVQYGATDFDVYAYDTVTGRTVPVAAGKGEQTAPRVANGIVYFLDLQSKGAIRLRAASASTGAAVAFNTYGTGDVAGTDADGTNTAWLEKTKTGWRVRGLFDTTPVGLTRVITASRAAAVAAVAALQPRDYVPPQVTGSYKRVLSPTSPAFVYFSERLDARSVSQAVRLVEAASGRIVPSRVAYVDLRRAVSVAPLAKLPAGQYEIAVSTALKDRAGNALPAAEVVGLGGVSAAAIARPYVPIASIVGSTGNVSIRWNAVAGAVGYRVFRLNRPITVADLIPANQVASVAVSPAVVAPASDEASTSYTYYYALYAQDSTGASSTLSDNTSPDPHGANVTGYSVYNCLRCHQAHGGPSAGSGGMVAVQATACYACHGGTAQATGYATGAPVNVQAQFNDYVPGVATAAVGAQGNGAWSIHRTNAMVQTRNECYGCHTTHKRPYYRDPATGAHGKAEADVSYPKLIRVPDSTNTAPLYIYSTETTPLANGTCFECHGTVGIEGSQGSLTSMIIANGGFSGAGGQSLDRTGGDHNSANWNSATLAHGAVNVTTMGVAGGPGIQCEVCHNNHGAATDRLIDYRRSGTQTVDAYRQANLCFECHTTQANGAEETRSPGARPYTWNGRDVKAEFGRVSHHPTSTAAAGGRTTCYSCHNTHYVRKGAAGTQWDISRVSDPRNTKSTPTTTTDFCMGCHGTATLVAGVSRTTVVPYAVTTSSVSTTFFPGWQKTMWIGSGHASATPASGRAWCDNCHDPHGSDFRRLVAWSSNNTSSWAGTTAVYASRSGNTTATRSNVDSGTAASFGRQVSREEALCLQCHGSGGSVATSDGVTIPTRKAPGAANVATAVASAYRHSSVSSSGAHADTETAAGLGVTNRHAECVDCHDPHVAVKVGGTALHSGSQQSTAGPALYGIVGVYPAVWGSNWATPSAGAYSAQMLDGGATDYEAYLCFKCHSNYVTLPTGPAAPARNTTPTNVAQEFNPNNFSTHNVSGAAVGMKTSFTFKDSTGTTITATMSMNNTASAFTGAWGVNSKMTCTDCHSNTAASAKGPHGSSYKWMIDPAYPLDWETAGIGQSTGLICNKCHGTAYTGTGGNNVHSRAGDHDISRQSCTCTGCHTKIPHGWRRPRMLGTTNDAVPYRSTKVTYINITAGALTSNNWSVGQCATNCSQHATTLGTYYP